MIDYSDYSVRYIPEKAYWAITHKGRQVGSAHSEEVARMIRRNHAKRAAREAAQGGGADR